MYRVSVESRTAFFALSKYRQPRTVESCRKDILQSGDTAGNRQMAKRTSSVSLASDPASLPDILQINMHTDSSFSSFLYFYRLLIKLNETLHFDEHGRYTLFR